MHTTYTYQQSVNYSSGTNENQHNEQTQTNTSNTTKAQFVITSLKLLFNRSSMAKTSKYSKTFFKKKSECAS